MVPSTALVVDDRIARTRSARSGSTFSTSAKLAINPVWFTGAVHQQATLLEKAGWTVTDSLVHTVEHGITYDERILIKHRA
jgi:hypothetical protein